MRVLITGITGFVGSHLADYILKVYPEIEIFGLKHWRSQLGNIERIINQVELIEADLKDESSVIRVLERAKPHKIFHLAAHSYVPTSWKMPSEVIVNNVGGQVSLLEAVRRICPTAQIQIAGSSEEYGFVKSDEMPINENNPLRPMSTYGVSKVAQDLLGYQYYKSYGMWIVRTRAFNHTGPRRGKVFVCSEFAKQIIEIERGVKPIIKVGNLTAIRDFTDVRDIIRGYWLALEKGKPGEVYNIGSGRAITMQQVLDMLLDISGISIKIVIDSDKLRPSDVPSLLCDYSKFKKQTGWEPEIEFKQTLVDLLNYWRKQYRLEEMRWHT